MLPRRLALLVGRNVRLTRGNFREHGRPKITVAYSRNLQTSSDGNPDHPTVTPKPKPTVPHQLHSPQRPQHRHEVQERTESLSVPGFNPPGGGGGPGPGGSSVFEMTGFPLFDAALTTIIGLGMGKYARSALVWDCTLNKT
jgi:hypothetical protein